MPPTENTTQTSTPAPEAPKQSFFAKLFGIGKKKDAAPVVASQESHTPPPQLDDPALPSNGVAEPVSPPEAVAVTSPNGPELSQSVPTVGASEEPQTLNVPDSLKSEPVDADGVNVSPTLPTQSAAPSEQSVVTPPAPVQPSESVPAPVAPPVAPPVEDEQKL